MVFKKEEKNLQKCTGVLINSKAFEQKLMGLMSP
jgi:hypothetical protein